MQTGQQFPPRAFAGPTAEPEGLWFHTPMDVRCERCKTEYEFDEERITEAGVTVKCTTCSHIFKVKKKALVVTVPIKPGEEEAHEGNGISSLSGAAVGPSPAAADKPREWKVRQASGNVFTFKELTTLQKWIVERKVSRDDEISLTGETWKRLGNIAELASFFQVVDEALKAAQLQALQTQGLLSPMMTPPHGNAMIGLTGANQPHGGQPIAPSGALPMVGSPAPQPAPQPPPPAPVTEAHPPLPEAKRSSTTQPMMAAIAPPTAGPALEQAPRMQAPSAAVGNEPRFASRPPDAVRSAARIPEDDGDDLEAAGLKRSGGGSKWLLTLLFLAALGGGGYYGYFNYYLPMQQKQQAQGGTAVVTPPVTGPAIDDPADAGSTVAVTAADAGPSSLVALNTPPADAGTGDEPDPDAGVASALARDAGDLKPVAATPETERRPPRADFDTLLGQADRLREREKLDAALDTYGRAADLAPTRAEPYAGRGLVLLDMGQKPQAEAAFREALKLNPRYAVAVMGLAETYRAMGRNEDAIRYYEKYLDILPNGPEAAVAKSAISRLKE